MKLEAQQPKLSLPVSPQRDHIRGNPEAPLTLLEYGDYECPYCGRAFPIVRKLQQELGDRLRLVFRHFPLNTIHPNASIAAQAAECAAAQGKFWEMHDILYEHQHDLGDRDIVQYAMKIGLEIYRFEADLSSERFVARVKEDFKSGVRSGVNGTPTFFINGTRYAGPPEIGAMLEALEQAAQESV
ncbi:MAG TPA: thioredoxin domain-containing protein [Tepidisphaeraceae bacterium]|jgi:protein-disulfide isomerase